MYSLSKALFPELVLIITASVLFILGAANPRAARKLAPILTLLALIIALVSQLGQVFDSPGIADPWQSVRISQFTRYVKLISAGIGVLLTLLAWPAPADDSAGSSIFFGQESGEFFGLMLLSIAGLFLTAGANDMMLLFLGLELASLPTYIMVSISRPLPVAQEAGVKYFFLGALAAALMLLGFSYLYGTTGTVYLHGGLDADNTALPGVDTVIRAAGVVTPWQLLALVILIVAFCFKMAAAPLHVYAADVYQGAATPVTAFLSFVPKASGFVALLKVLYAVGGGSWALPPQIGELLWWIALLTMTCGNFLGLLQQNVKRILAYSSIAHSGYMLVGAAALVTAGAASQAYQTTALRGILFYLAAYGLTNIAAFGVLILLPGRGGAAETLDQIAGLGRQYVGLGLAMAVACFSLIGIPLTVGFVGKVLLIQPALQAGLIGLVVVLVINSAISAAYYLRIIATLFLRPSPVAISQEPRPSSTPVLTAVVCSALGVVLLGAAVPFVNRMVQRAQNATQMDIPATVVTPASTFASASR